MKIAHYKKTPIALAPDELSDCINKYTEHESYINEKFNDISIVYIDPPYLVYDINKLLCVLQNKVMKNCIIGIETSIKDNLIIPNKLKLIKNKKYGKTNISLLILS